MGVQGYGSTRMRAGPTSSDPTVPQTRVAAMLNASSAAVVLTGAGISVPSGIPDFRTPMTGLWANVDPMQVAHIDVWRDEPERFWAFYGQRFHTLGPAQPNDAHRAVAQNKLKNRSYRLPRRGGHYRLLSKAGHGGACSAIPLCFGVCA